MINMNEFLIDVIFGMINRKEVKVIYGDANSQCPTVRIDRIRERERTKLVLVPWFCSSEFKKLKPYIPNPLLSLIL